MRLLSEKAYLSGYHVHIATESTQVIYGYVTPQQGFIGNKDT